MEYIYILYIVLAMCSAIGLTAVSMLVGFIVRDTKTGNTTYDLGKLENRPATLLFLNIAYTVFFIATIVFSGLAGANL